MQLFPVEIVATRPAEGNGKDVKLFGFDQDGVEYAIKTLADNPRLPATEYFCYRLASACRLAVPVGALLKVPGHEGLAFGSRFEGGLTVPNNQTHENAMLRMRACAGAMSAAYAMDMFIGNEDRHIENFLYRANSANDMLCMPIDYSRAWMAGGWPPRKIAQSACTTMNQVQILRATHLWNPDRAMATMTYINTIQKPTVSRWLEEMPETWLQGDDRETLLDWWQGRDFAERVNDCIKYCQ